MFSLRRSCIVGFNQLRNLSKSAKVCQGGEPLSIPRPDGSQDVFSDKIEQLVLDISKLTLLEVSELSTALKQRLNLPDAPLMPMVGVAPAKSEEDEETVQAKSVQTSFTVKMMKFDEKQKVALIKECKNLLDGMNLVQAKKFVESCPTVVKADLPKDEAEKLKEALSKVGAEIVIE